jgi:hypothetical protein
MAQVVEHPHSQHKTLSSNPKTAKKKKSNILKFATDYRISKKVRETVLKFFIKQDNK